MATKKEKAAAEAMDTAEERDPVTALGGPEESGQEPEQSGQEPEESTQEPEQSGQEAARVTLVYIGPSLPYGKMRSSMILTGTEEEINGFLEEIKEQYPEVTHLLVPPDRLTEALEKVARKGTILHKYYEDMLAKSRASRKG